MILKLGNAIEFFVTSILGRVAIGFALMFFIWTESHGRNDWDIFMSAAIDLFNKKNIYTEVYFGSYHYYYSVLFASALKLLSLLPMAFCKALWLMLNLFFVYRIAQIVFYYLADCFSSVPIRYVFGLFLLIVSFRFLRGNLHLGQMTIAMLCLSLEALYRIQNKQWLLGSMALSIAINIKILPIVLLPYLLYRSQWMALVPTVVFMFCWWVLPAVWMGWQHNLFLLDQWWALVNPNNMRHIKDLEETSFHSLSTLISTLFTDYVNTEQGLQSKHNFANLNEQQLFQLILAVRLFFVVFTLCFLRTLPFVRVQGKLKTWWEVSYILLLVPLIFPHQQHYAFLMAVPAMAYLMAWFFNIDLGSGHWKNVLLLSMYLVVVVCFNMSLLVPALTPWLNHYKLITYAALELVVLLAFAKPTWGKSKEILSV